MHPSKAKLSDGYIQAVSVFCKHTQGSEAPAENEVFKQVFPSRFRVLANRLLLLKIGLATVGNRHFLH